MGKLEWLVFTCRACRKVIKLSPAMAGGSVVCPYCRTKVSVPRDAMMIEETPQPSQIPASRNSDEILPGIRGKGREEWEVGNKPVGGDLAFRERLNATTLPELQMGAEGTEMIRASLRRRKEELAQEAQENGSQETPARKRRRKTRSRGVTFSRIFVRGLVIAVIITAAAAAWMGWELYRQMHVRRKPVQPPFVQEDPPQAAPAADGQSRLESRSFADYGPALRETVLRFTGAKSVDEILPLIRDRARLEPKIRAFYGDGHPWQPFEIRNSLQKDEPFVVDGDFIVLNLVLANFDGKPLSLERQGDSFLVDWESFTGYGDLTWEALKETRPREPVMMRVVIERSPATEYFNGPFADPKTHHCYQLRDLSSQHQISGYALKDAATDVQIRKALASPAREAAPGMPAVVRIRYPEAGGSGPHQVEMVEFLEKGWVFRPDP